MGKVKPFDKRVIHLDLKGLPPLPERLLELPVLWAAAGYNGVLIEFEDMFPWTVDERFQSVNYYSKSDLRYFSERCSEHGVEIIPLVQVLGHMETFLRPETYALLREVPGKHDVLNCLADGAADFALSLIEDVLRVFPDVEYFHLGCDEAWTFGAHPQTFAFIEECGKIRLLFRHLKPLARLLEERGIRPIVWHDMFTECSTEDLADFGCPVELMVWGYGDEFDDPESLYNTAVMEKLAGLGLPLWAAGAYKGADGAFANLPDIENRHKN
ncbi:MAG: family 20 glycosylhydrolase, partial [Verrucomicrobiota bacterium]